MRHRKRNDPTPVWGPVQAEMAEALSVLPTDVAGVVETLEGLQGILKRLPPVEQRNPVAVFNTLYTRVTRCVLADLNAGLFEHPEFLTTLDLEFAALYFDALRRFTGMVPRPTPASWAVLFDRRGDRSVRAIPAAAVGVNAHVNRDLTLALLATLEKLGLEPVERSGDERTPQYADYLHINTIFRQQIPPLRHDFETDLARVVDWINGTLDDRIQGWLLVESRQLAWDRAEKVWPRRRHPEAVSRLTATMDRRAARLGRFLFSLCWLQ